MDIGFATFFYYPFGGLEKSLRNIALEVLRRGHDLTLYCYFWKGDLLPGAKLEVLPARGWTNHRRMSSFAGKLQQRISARNHDLLVGFKRMPGLDLYYNGDVCYKNEISSKNNPLIKLMPRYRVLSSFENDVFSRTSSTHIMYISEREKNIFQNYYGTPDFRFHALPPGIDKNSIRNACSNLKRGRLRKRLGVSDDILVALMVGSDFYRKGVDRSIRALAALPAEEQQKVELWIAGQGVPEPFIKLARKLDVEKRIRFLGARDDVPELLAISDFLLHPAVSETAGNAILEGLVAGIPVIVSQSAGFSYHVAEAGGGMVIPDTLWCQSHFDLAFRRLVNDSKLRGQLGQRGWRYADTTDLYHRPQVAADIIERMAKEKSGENTLSGDVFGR
jgi:UDP-glucose:(heptosyl)LPS alpha-1,3-glucosyltransferase